MNQQKEMKTETKKLIITHIGLCGPNTEIQS